ncbi:MAG: hypothetical protein MI741_09825, partial [Rhodospirillales bacterium]|nr:hypothetical protein [Rhodospirillales bacterium]
MSKPANNKSQPRLRHRLLAAVAVAAAVLMIGAIFALPRMTVYTDHLSVRQPTHNAVLRLVLWESPNQLAGSINEPTDNYEPCFSADGRTLIFTRGRAQQNADLYEATWDGAGWIDPKPIESLNTDADEL